VGVGVLDLVFAWLITWKADFLAFCIPAEKTASFVLVIFGVPVHTHTHTLTHSHVHRERNRKIRLESKRSRALVNGLHIHLQVCTVAGGGHPTTYVTPEMLFSSSSC